jgi:probable F420-dependent oxidoreductase
VKFGVTIPTYGAWGDPGIVGDGVQAAEDLGFDTVWFGDHIVIPSYAAHLSPPNWLEALSCAFVCVGATKRIRFGVDVLVLPYRNPIWLSQLVASADQLSGGRLTIGTGVGYLKGEFDALGAPDYDQRGAVTDEYLEVLTTLWESEGPVSFAGRWVNFADIHAAPRPAQRPMPLWVGGNIRAARRRAALHGNGWHPLFPTADEYREGRADILDRRAAAEIAGDFAFSYSCPPTRLMLTDAERPVAAGYGTADLPDDYRYAPPFPTAPNGRARFIGTPDEMIGDISDLKSAGVEHLALRFSIGTPAEDLDHVTRQMQRFMEHVAPAFVD